MVSRKLSQCPFPTVADPGDGPGRSGPLPLIFRPN